MDPCKITPTTHPVGTQYCSTTHGDVGNGYAYDLYTTGLGTGCMTVFGVDATFKAEWSSASDFLARVGLTFDDTKSPDQIGTISSDFAFTKSGSGIVWLGIHGWLMSPQVEYYIVEDWGGLRPTTSTKKGTIIVDGAAYDVYQRLPASDPGPMALVQYWSVRQTGRQCGKTSVSEHFAKWASLGMQIGKLHETRLFVEGQNGGSGAADFAVGTVVVK